MTTQDAKERKRATEIEGWKALGTVIDELSFPGSHLPQSEAPQQTLT